MPTSRAMTETPCPTPVNREAPFGIDELFFSSTDPHSIIREGNAVFTRVSGYTREHLIGTPHNVVRHPDMPRGVFRLFWDRLGAGRPVAAYVKNMSADGSYCWVMAAAVPTPQGFLSVRLKPSSPHLETVKALYAQVREAERDLEAMGHSNAEVAEQGRDMLLSLLAEAGYHRYTAFERVTLPAEIVSRESQVGSGAATGGSGTVLTALGTTAASLSALFEQVGEYQAGSRALEASSTLVRALAEDVRLNAINGLVAAQRLSADGATLAVVADRMTHAAHDISRIVATLDQDLAPAVETMGDLAFRISVAKLQVDMARAYASEAEGGCADGACALAELTGCLADSNAAVVELTGEMRRRLSRAGSVVGDIENTLKPLGALHICGRIEVAGVRDAAGFRVLLDDVKVQLDEGATQVDALREAAERCNADGYDLDTLTRQTEAVRSALVAA